MLIFGVYVATARLGLILEPVSGFATLIWLPSGISLATLMIWGVKFWPIITLGAIVAGFWSGVPILTAAGISIGNTLQSLLAVHLLRNFFAIKNSLEKLRDVIIFIIIAGALAVSMNAAISVSILFLSKIVTASSLFETWMAWIVGNMISNLTITPFLLVWSTNMPFKLTARRFLEIITLTALLLVANLFIFSLPYNNQPVTYVFFPPLVWAALRFGQRGTTLITLIIAAISTWGIIFGVGPFVTNKLSESLLSLQIFVGFLAISGMVLAAVFTEKEKVEGRKDEFISIASHELKTPVTTIKGYSQILAAYFSKVNNKLPLSYLHKIDEQVDRLTKLVNDLLDVSKIQSGKLELEKESFQVNKLIKDTIEAIQLGSRHKIIFQHDADADISIVADKHLIGQVITNLISNAIKYSPKADKVLVNLSSNAANVKISVQDFGIGIARKDFGRLFERFFRVNNKIRESFSGLGLGLFICSEIIKRHRGHIQISSIKGKGSTFTAVLPRRTNYG